MHRFIAKILHKICQPPPSSSEKPSITRVAKEDMEKVPEEVTVAAMKANEGLAQVPAASKSVDTPSKSPSSPSIPRKPVPKSTSANNAPPSNPPSQPRQRPNCTCSKSPPRGLAREKAHSLRHPQPSSSSPRKQPSRPHPPTTQTRSKPSSASNCPLHPSKSLSSDPEPDNLTRFHSQQAALHKTIIKLEKQKASTATWKVYAAHEHIRKALQAQLKAAKADNDDWAIAIAYVRAAACGIPFQVAKEAPTKSLRDSAAGLAARVVAGFAKVREDAATKQYRQRMRHLQDLRKSLDRYRREYSALRSEQHRIAATIRVLRTHFPNKHSTDLIANPNSNTNTNTIINTTHNAANNRCEHALSQLAKSIRKARVGEKRLVGLIERDENPIGISRENPSMKNRRGAHGRERWGDG